MSTTKTQDPLVQEFAKLIRQKQVDEIETLWTNNLTELPNKAAFFKDWVKSMQRIGAGDRAESMLVQAIEDRLERNKPRSAMRILLAVIPSYATSEEMRPLTIKTVKVFYRDIEQIDEIIRHSNIEGDVRLPDAFQTIRNMVRLCPGQVYKHYDWGVGVVERYDIDADLVVLRFPRDPAKEMKSAGVQKFLEYIEPTHFEARKAKDPESMLKLAESDPAELIKQALGSQADRALRQSELKAMLTTDLIEPKSWNTWWGKAREALKLDPYTDFETTGGARAMIRLRDTPRTFAEEIDEQFFADDAGTALKAELIRQVAARPDEPSIDETLGKRMAQRLREDWALLQSDGSLTARLEVAYMLADLAQAFGGIEVEVPDTGDLLSQVTVEQYNLLHEIDHVDYGIRAIEALIGRDGEDGCRAAAALLPHAPAKLAQAIWKSLDHEHHIEDAVRALEVLLQNPFVNIDTYAWAVRAILDRSWEHLEDYFPPIAVVPDILEYMEEAHARATDEDRSKAEQDEARSFITRMRTLLAANHCDAIGRAIEEMNRDTAVRMRQKIRTHSALPSNFLNQAERIIRITRTDLDEEEIAAAQANAAQEGDDEIHLCTARAYAEKAAELREITSHKIPHNAKVIEDARAEGDLRENAGYQYAKEEQKMLLQQQATISDQLSRAKVMQPDDIEGGNITFGSRFTALNLDSNEEETYTVLGRWEANAERNILSIKAPLASQFLGRTIGDELTITRPGADSTPYRVLKVENALSDPEWVAHSAQVGSGETTTSP